MSLASKIDTVFAAFRKHGWTGLKPVLFYKLLSLRQRYRYQKWIRKLGLRDKDREALRRQIKAFPRRPLISIILPVYNVEEKWLRLCLESVLSQIYGTWELCIADDASTVPHVGKVLEEYAGRDSRIRIAYRTENGHISAASNSALELASGELCVLLDHDDELSEDALFYVAKEINDFPEAKLIYSDEDLISDRGKRHGPKFKPDWSRDFMYSGNLVTHLSAFRTDLLRKIGGFTLGLEGSQDYDLALRVIEEIPESHIRHIPKILYHWRVIETSVSAEGNAKPYAHENARKAIRAHLERTGKKAEVLETVHNLHRVHYQLPEKAPLVSLVMAFKDHSSKIDERMDVISKQTEYPNFEIIAVCGGERNGSAVGRGQKVDAGSAATRIAVSATESEAGRLNEGATNASGDILCFVDPNLTPDSPDWLDELVGFAIQEEIGAVGAKLLYPNGTLMHGGLLIGVGGTVGIAHHGWPAESDGNITRTRLIGNFSAVSALCMAVRRNLFEKAGMFEADLFPNDLFDADFCLKLRKLGKRIVWTPYVRLLSEDFGKRESRYRDPLPIEKKNFEKNWKQFVDRDPFYNPNLSRKSGDFFMSLARASETTDSNLGSNVCCL